MPFCIRKRKRRNPKIVRFSTWKIEGMSHQKINWLFWPWSKFIVTTISFLSYRADIRFKSIVYFSTKSKFNWNQNTHKKPTPWLSFVIYQIGLNAIFSSMFLPQCCVLTSLSANKLNPFHGRNFYSCAIQKKLILRVHIILISLSMSYRLSFICLPSQPWAVHISN